MFTFHGWSIRQFLRLKDNYFGGFTRFSTVQEYIDKRSQGSVGDPVVAKYRKGKVRDYARLSNREISYAWLAR